MRSERTPRTAIRAAVRRLFLRSRERGAALKRDGYKCQKCGIKKTKTKEKEVKVEVHHIHGIGNWDLIIDAIEREILCDPVHLQTLCKECHQKEK